MHWFLIAYTAAGLSVAVGPPKDKEFCSDMQATETFHYKDERPEKGYTFKCEQHKQRPKMTGKPDRDLQHWINRPCYGLGISSVGQGMAVIEYWSQRQVSAQN